jgi:hypothetical protein
MDRTQVRRLPGGSIDFDFYRSRAAALRSRTLRDAVRRNATLRLTLVTIVGLIALGFAVASHTAQAGGW